MQPEGESKVLLLLPRGTAFPEIQALRPAVEDQLHSLAGKKLTVVDSLTWYQSTFAACGNWESWIWETVTSKDYYTRQLVFRGYVLAQSLVLSRANAGIIRLALSSGRPVFFYLEGHPLQAVSRVVERDPEDFSSGWEAETKAIGV